MSFARLSLSLVAVSVLLSSGCPSFAVDAGIPTTSPATPAAAPASQPLQGQVQTINLDLQDLRELGIDIKRVRTATSQLYEEVARQPVTIQEEPEMIGETIIQIPVSFTGGGYLPPRKKWVDFAMSNLRPFMAEAKEEVDDITSGRKLLNLTQSTKGHLAQHFNTWVGLVNSMDARMQQLEPLTQGPTYDNQAIANVCIGMEKDLKELEKTRREIYKVIQRDNKEVAKEEKADARK